MWFQSILLSMLTLSSDQVHTRIPAYVFMPNPVLSSGMEYGRSFIDNGDDMSETLRSEVVEVQIDVEMNGDVVYLSDSIIQLVNLSAPNQRVDGFQRGNIRADRSLPSFESVSCIYHIRRFQGYLRVLGFGQHIKPIRVDPKALTGSDHSRFSSNSEPPVIEYGVGGVDDAEDGQVVIHEYMHAILHEATQGSRKSLNVRIFEEAVCDFFCLRYSEQVTGKADRRVFSWDGHNEFWDGYAAKWHGHQIVDPVCDERCQREKWLYLLRTVQSNIRSETFDQLLLELFSSASSAVSHEMIASQFAQRMQKELGLDLTSVLVQHGILTGDPRASVRKLYVIGGVCNLEELEYYERAELYRIDGTPIFTIDLHGNASINLPLKTYGTFLMCLTNKTQFPKKEEWFYLIVL